jgi:hypothetical protein
VLGHDVLARQVEAGRQRGLEEQHGACTAGQQRAVELDAHLARAAAHVDAVVGVARVADERLVLLEPGVEAREVEDHVAGQVGVGRREGDGLARGVAGAQRQALPAGRVRGERDPGVQDGRLRAVRARRGHELAADVLDRHRERRHDPPRLPDEHRAGAVDDGVGTDQGADALLDGLVAQRVELLGHRIAHPGGHRVSLAGAAPRPATRRRRPAASRGRR